MANNIPRITATDPSDDATSASFLPRIYRTDSNKKFLHSTINQLTQPGAVKKVSGYIGRQYSKATLSDDTFVNAPTRNRQNYQLEPGLVIEDNMHNNVFLKDYQDYINQLRVFGADVSNHSRLNKQEFYSWNPHIDWDKFVNFQNYYWMPHGPDTITIQNKSKIQITSTYTVNVETTEYGSSYIFSPDGMTRNPVITLYRGQQYKFIINSVENPFSIKTLRTTGPLDRYINPLLLNNAIETGTITFTVPNNAPDELAYVSENNIDMGGVFNILDVSETGYINVESDLIGKKTYSYGTITLVDETIVPFALSNGMKVQFAGNVFPKKYATGRYYVEGVGDAIRLIHENDLQIITAYTNTSSMLFDTTLFDTTPFSDSISYVTNPDYIVINRASVDKNFWSRNNKWIHKDVIEKSALKNGIHPAYDQSMRAARPIIEFEKNLKLFNFGTTSIIDIAVIDTVTVDAFSIVEGAFGYNIDGVDLKDGQHVIFTADLDDRVTNNIYRIDFINVLHENSLQKISSKGKIESISATNTGWTAKITNMNSTVGLNVGTLIAVTDKTGKLGGGPSGSAGSARVSAIIDSTSIEYRIIGGNKPTVGTVADIICVINSNQIRLVEVAKPVYNQVALIQYGTVSQGQMYWFNSTEWKLCQQKTKANQPPLFDLVDENEYSFGDLSVYPGTSFDGTSIFSYKVGTTLADKNLGFALSYKNINNIGDIVFNFSLVTDKFSYEVNEKIVSKQVDTGFLIKYDAAGKISYVNGWKTSEVEHTQAAIRLYRNSDKTNNFDIDIFDYLPSLSEFEARVYVNNVRSNDWIFKPISSTNRYLNYHQIIFNTDVKLTDSIMIKVYSNLPVNANGYFEIPINLQNNPLNGVLSEFTLGEVIDHVGSIVDNVHTSGFFGKYPGISNLRDLGSVSQYGTKFVQHSGPASLSMYHITSDTNNIIRAIDQSRDDYCKFKKTFMFVAESLGVDADEFTHVNLILHHINKDAPSTSAYYFSDMAPYGSRIQTDFLVAAPEDNLFSLSQVFSLSTLSSTAVGVYLNGMQLLHGKEYSFTDQGFIYVTAELTAGDTITVYEYESTDGCLIPETPTKLGMWPKYEPKIFLDTTLRIPVNMIQGHDGSLTLAYNDYRDALVLELEKRIYNNIKVKYDPTLFDVADVIPAYSRKSDYSREQFNSSLMSNFYKWSSKVGVDFATPLSYDTRDSFTFSYSKHAAPDGRVTPGFWRGIYQWILDTDRPHMCPWEMLGFSEEPSWWISVYGPAPYTKNNLILWQDISRGLVKEPNKLPIRLKKYVKPFLMDHIPVDDDGKLRSPYDINLATGYITPSIQGDFIFGDVSPIEAAWRRNSHYAFSVIKTAILLNPARVIGVLLDRSRIVISKTGQLIYTDTNLRITPSSIKLPTVYLSSNRNQTAGLVNYLINYIDCNTLTQYNNYKFELENIVAKLCYRVSAYTSKEKFNLLLDSKSPIAVGSIFIPQEDYTLVLNSSSPIGILTYSGVVITKIAGGFEVKGYSQLQPYFKYFPSLTSGVSVNVAGISESFVEWAQGQDYFVGSLVKYLLRYYRVLVDHKSTVLFDFNKFYSLEKLPIVGGVNAYFKNKWDTTAKIIPYGTKLNSIQEVVDFLLGYGKWLSEQGFLFNEYNPNLSAIENWETSAKEFMFWTTQNWSAPNSTWADWTTTMTIRYGDIVRYNGSYYKALKDMQPTVFNESEYYLLNGLDLSGHAVISLSPSANKLVFNTILTTIDDVTNPNNEYEILNASGVAIHKSFINMFRIDNAVTYIPKTDDGIFCASFYLIQREHVVVLNNTTMFNDTIYNPESGYKQDKIKVSGYVSSDWNGTLSAPGFIVDRAIITEWTPWKNYIIGDTVKYKSFYYSANSSLAGAESFDSAKWSKLDKKPTPKLLPNWTYKATQFTDFYSLDSENFDIAQQNYAQHLIGYQKRQYLKNIIQDDVSEYKFYQGMIIEKGTQNVLNKLFDVLSAAGNESLQFYEEWAVRTGQYGACSSFESIEFVLSESQFKINPQGFELVNTKDRFHETLVIQQGVTDIYVKPARYTPNLWPVAKPLKTSTVYARVDEVAFSVKQLSDINIAMVKNGDYILCTFAPTDWNIYQYFDRSITNSYKINITLITTDDDGVHITLDNMAEISVGTLIGFKQVGDDGFYTVNSIQNNIITIVTDAVFAATNYSTVGLLIPRRINTTIDSNNYTNADLQSKYLIWTDNDSNVTDYYQDTSNWKVWEYNPVYALTARPNLNSKISQYGRAIATTDDGATIAVSQKSDNGYEIFRGEVVIYNNTKNGWIATQIIKRPLRFQSVSEVDNEDNVATVVALSPDGEWLALGSPTADTQSRGVISIYKRDINSLYVLVDTRISPEPLDNEHFGNSIAFGTNMMFVGTTASTVYRYEYKLTEKGFTTFVSNGSKGTTLVVASTAGISRGMILSGNGFTPNHLVSSVVNGTTIIISPEPAEKPAGRIAFSVYEWVELPSISKPTGASNAFGTDISVSLNNTIAISDPSTNGKVYVYYANEDFVYNSANQIDNIVANTVGQHISLSKNDDFIAISNKLSSTARNVNIYSLLLKESVQVISTVEFNSANAPAVFFTDDYRTLVICDFDYVSVADVYNIYEKDWIFSERLEPKYASPIFAVTATNLIVGAPAWTEQVATINLINNTTHTGTTATGRIDKDKDLVCKIEIEDRIIGNGIPEGSVITAVNPQSDFIDFTVTFPIATTITTDITTTYVFVSSTSNGAGKLYEYVKPVNQFSWTVKNTSITKPDITKVKQAFLYNKVSNKLIKYLDVVDPIQNKHPIIAEREVKYKSPYDPAIYSHATTTVVTVDEGIAWGAAQVGSLWWDVRTTKFFDNFTDNSVYRNSMLGTLATGASVDIYEWVETELLPADWDAEADTSAGLAQGISGTSLYGDSAYVEVKTYDTISQQFSSTYYYWVKNKETISSTIGRTISAANVSRLISNPKGEGYEYLALTGLNSFSLVNVKPYLLHDDIVLSIEYWLIDKTDQNIHTQWKLISTSSSTEIPASIEQKWIDSLCGKDVNDRLVPDQLLPPKLKYGIENRPRQSMFVNRFEAIKQVIEQTNIHLKSELIVDTRDLSLLTSYDTPPTSIRRLYDTTLDTNLELQYVITKYYIAPSLTADITDGKITNVNIISSGRGYLIAPYITVTGTGNGAVIQSIINESGQIIGVKIVNGGKGYTSNNVLTVRSFSVLVLSDATSNGKWSIYSYVLSTNTWYKSLTYTYDTTKYWKYVDWYKPGFNQFTTATHLVTTYAELSQLNDTVGDIVKVKTTNSGRWVLLQKHNPTVNQQLEETASFDWTHWYTVIGSQNGTIQFSSLLYDFYGTVIGYDGMLYDSGMHDNFASIELRNILIAIKDDLLIGNLKTKYLELFFSTVRYAMNEQTYIDWIFKTSFVNVMHQVGKLQQRVTYKNDNLSNFEDYVSEVKPYRTQIREYISSYTNLDDSNVAITDFDLPPAYDLDRNVVSVVDYDNPLINSYPWKFWLDNVGYSLVDIKITSGGAEYLTEPAVTIESETGLGATARAFIVNKQISRIKLITPGSGYKTTPKIVITGGYSSTGKSATAIPILGKSVVRTSNIALKFDRVNQNYLIDNLQHVETIKGASIVTGTKVQFILKWIPDVSIGKTSVTVNGVLEIRDNYKMGTVISIVDGHPVHTGVITFKTAPMRGSELIISYYKDTGLLTATDRIHYYYKPNSGDVGNDLPQLMSGIDYGGVVVSGLSFEVDHGWDSMPYYNDTWDNFDPALNDVKYTLGDEFSYTIKLPYVPTIGTRLNVYLVKPNTEAVRIDSSTYNIDVVDLANPNVAMLTPIATGDTDIIEIPTSISADAGDTIIIRKETSDGAIVNEYDTALSGGNFSYNAMSAGLSAEDIVVDGDDFNSVTAGIGPEEVVPGQVIDTLGIKVFNKLPSGEFTSFMHFKNMLNRYRYIRLNANKRTRLVNELNYYDTTITVEDSSLFDQPSYGSYGIIDINGERIEFFSNVDNVLSGLRRGTMGTGIPTVHRAESIVQELGLTETIPYVENTQIEQVVSNGTHFINLSYTPNKVANTKWSFADPALAEYGQSDEIEVFVGGYDDYKIWTLETVYYVNDIVNVGVYVYRCAVQHVSSSNFKNDRSKWNYFIGNIRLKKTPYIVYNINSAEGNHKFDADFSVNGTTKQIRLTNVLSANTIVTIIKRQGSKWINNQTELNFIGSVPGVDYADISITYDSTSITFDSEDTRF